MQEGIDINQNRADNNLYSDNFGENLASYTNMALSHKSLVSVGVLMARMDYIIGTFGGLFVGSLITS